MAELANRFRNCSKQPTNNGGQRIDLQYSGNADRSRRFWNPQPPPPAEPNGHTPGPSNKERGKMVISVKPPNQTLNLPHGLAFNVGTYHDTWPVEMGNCRTMTTSVYMSITEVEGRAPNHWRPSPRAEEAPREFGDDSF